MKTLLFTRYLYAADEVVLSLLFALLNKKDLFKCYWWAYELYYSEFDIKPIIWQMYYDFYAQLNPFLEKYIQSKLIKMDSGDETALACIIKNLFNKTTTDSVFCIRLSFDKVTFPNSIYRGKLPKWLEDYDKKYHNLLRSLKSRNWINTIYYIKKLLKNNDLTSKFENNNIQTNYTEFENIYLTICNYIDKQEEYIALKFNEQKIIDLFNRIKYDNYIHRLIALLAFIWSPVEKLNINRIFVIPTQEEIDFIKNTNAPLDLNKFNNPQVYNTISIKRLYKISKKISCFALNQDEFNYDYNSLINQYLYNWEYHCSQTPIWVKRFKQFGVCFDDETYQPIFPNDDYQELFYDSYGYEMDESHVWNKAQYSFPQLKSISKKEFNLSKWLEKVFENNDEDIRLGLDNIKISIKRQPYYIFN